VDLSVVGNDIEKVIVTEEQLKAKVKELAERIDVDYRDHDLLIVGVLKGAIMAMADLSRALQRHVDMDWMAVSSYGSGTKSSGVVRILKDLDRDITGREVLIVEDIVDSGLTLSWLKANLESRGAKSVEVLAILRKSQAAKVDVKVKYVGFEIPTDFVVGYGLDFNEKSQSSVCRRTSKTYLFIRDETVEENGYQEKTSPQEDTDALPTVDAWSAFLDCCCHCCCQRLWSDFSSRK
jgi:hypoxanthine phosphoribosyltransferase